MSTTRFAAAAVTAMLFACPATVKADSAKAIRTPSDAVADSAAIVEGRVTDISYSYDPQTGPRTIATLADVKSHRGSVGTTIRLATLGGPLPDGTFLTVSELPDLRVGGKYLLFLTSSEWFYSPIITDYAFRVEQIGGREVIVNRTGNPVTFAGPDTISTAPQSIDVPDNDFTTRFDPPKRVADHVNRAVGALQKNDFLAIFANVALSAAPARAFRTTLTPKKQAWNVTPTAPAPGSAGAANGAAASSKREFEPSADRLVCDSDPASEQLVCVDGSGK